MSRRPRLASSPASSIARKMDDHATQKLPGDSSVKQGLIIALALAPTIVVATVVVTLFVVLHRRRRRAVRNHKHIPPAMDMGASTETRKQPRRLQKQPTSPVPSFPATTNDGLSMAEQVEIQRQDMIRKALASRRRRGGSGITPVAAAASSSSAACAAADAKDTGIVCDWKSFEEAMRRERSISLEHHPVTARGRHSLGHAASIGGGARRSLAAVIESTWPCRSPPPVYQRNDAKSPPPVYNPGPSS